MTTELAGQVFTIEIFEVWSDLTKIESFNIDLRGQSPRIESPPPTTYRISVWASDQLRILDVRNSKCLLEEKRLLQVPLLLLRREPVRSFELFRTFLPWVLANLVLDIGPFPRYSFLHPVFTFPTSQTVIIKDGKDDIRYHAGTGEVLEPARTPSNSSTCWYTDWSMYAGDHYRHHDGPDEQGIRSKGIRPVSEATFTGGWVKDHKRKHLLWIPIERRASQHRLGWVSNITVLSFTHHGRTVTVMLQPDPLLWV